MSEDHSLDCLDALISLLYPANPDHPDDADRYYEQEFLPLVVSGVADLLPPERKAVDALREVLTESEWTNLPALYRARVTDDIVELEYDVRRRAEREAEAARAQEERRRMEDAARKREAQDRARAQEEERHQRETEARRDALLRLIRERCDSGFLGVRSFVEAQADRDLVSGEHLDRVLADYVREWAQSTLDLTLDRQQAAAVAAVDGQVLVTARAGAGKTRALVTRALFLQSHCGVAANEMLLLAFNRRAAKEMRERLAEHLGEDLPHVMTFHALAYAIVHPEERLVFDDEEAGSQTRSRLVQEAVDRMLRDPGSAAKVRAVMIAQFKDDWDRVVLGGYDLPGPEMLALRRSLVHETLAGEYVKSYGEKLIANILFENDIDYHYERNHHWDGVNYRPDFTILTGRNAGVVVEYFGMAGDPDYDDQVAAKRVYWSGKKSWTLIERKAAEVVRGTPEEFEHGLIEELRRAGISSRRLSEEEIWERIRHRAIDQFTQTATGFIGRARKLNLDSSLLRDRIAEHLPATDGERLFLDVISELYQGYLDGLNKTESDDFDGLLWRSIDVLRRGSSRFARQQGKEQGDLRPIRFLMLDEFQDFNEAFLQMTLAIRELADDPSIFCVGDPWQAINRFAGSDPTYFEEFEKYLGPHVSLEVPTNYRSGSSIVELGNTVMTGFGTPSIPSSAVAGKVQLYSLDHLDERPAEQLAHDYEMITPAVLRLVQQALRSHESVTMLSRRRTGLPWYGGRRGLDDFLVRIRGFLKETDRKRIGASTVHKYKGMEDSCVIVLDAVDRSFPLIHPAWIFQRIFGDELPRLHEDERRLFYVAVTRSQSSLILITDSAKPSPFLDHARSLEFVQTPRWIDLPSVVSNSGEAYELRAYNAYEHKELLKQDGFSWPGGRGKYWRRLVGVEYVSRREWESAPWYLSPLRLVVLDGDGRPTQEFTA